jgi:hypothetical protein
MFRRLVLEELTAAFDAGRLHFFTGLSRLNDKAAFAAALAPLRRADWIVYAKRTFGGQNGYWPILRATRTALRSRTIDCSV